MRILLVEDDRLIGEGLESALRQGGYSVDWVKNGEDALHSLLSEDYKLVVLDLGLPKKSGLEVLKELRQNKKETAVLVLTARDSIQDRVTGLDSGADDYMIKPFALEELEARMRLLLRRQNGQHENVLVCGDLTLNPITRKISQDEQSFLLSAKEYAIMYALMEKPKVVLSRAQLEERIYGWNEEVSSNSIEVHIHQLRKKLGKDFIKNMRGLGYTLKA